MEGDMAGAHADVLTEVGTNELEVVEFYIEDRPYAVNVAKVREIVRPQRVLSVPESHPCVMGVFRNREDVLPLVDLGKWLGAASPPDPSRAKIIVAEFNQMRIGFMVHGVARIHRLSWEDLEAPDTGSMAHSRSALGLMRFGRCDAEEERVVFLLDFERMVEEFKGNAVRYPATEAEPEERRRGKVVLVAEDSPLIRKMMVRELEGGGYTVLAKADGKEAWEALAAGARADAVISDIEMPRMDGHHLTRRIKESSELSHLPVILYSSMIYEEMRRKGDAVGADAQICKPDLPRLLETVDGLIFA
jgi:two-component system chemotaxis response regulator CheV